MATRTRSLKRRPPKPQAGAKFFERYTVT